MNIERFRVNDVHGHFFSRSKIRPVRACERTSLNIPSAIFITSATKGIWIEVPLTMTLPTSCTNLKEQEYSTWPR